MARGRKSSLRIVLSPEDRQTLEQWQRSTTIAAGLARRGKIILLLAAGHSQSHVAQAVGVQRTVVRKWARRFLAQRLDGLADAPGRGAKGVFSPRSRDARGTAGLRASGGAGPQSLPVGLRRAGAPAHRNGAG
jgi:Helix-turn-helix domain